MVENGDRKYHDMIVEIHASMPFIKERLQAGADRMTGMELRISVLEKKVWEMVGWASAVAALVTIIIQIMTGGF